MDVILILAIVLVLVFIGALIYVKRRPAGWGNDLFFKITIEGNEFFCIVDGNENGERPVAPRRPAPVNDDRPRAAQVRNRRRFNPARGYDDGAPMVEADDRR